MTSEQGGGFDTKSCYCFRWFQEVKVRGHVTRSSFAYKLYLYLETRRGDLEKAFLAGPVNSCRCLLLMALIFLAFVVF